MKVKATKDFRVGPRKRIAVAKGEIHEANTVTSIENGFYINLPHGGMFGWCRLNDGWELCNA